MKNLTNLQDWLKKTCPNFYKQTLLRGGDHELILEFARTRKFDALNFFLFMEKICSGEFEFTIEAMDLLSKSRFNWLKLSNINEEVDELIVPDNLKNEGDYISNETLKGKICEKESIRKRKDGTFVHVRIQGVPIKSDEQLIGIYGIYEDISDRKLLLVLHLAMLWRVKHRKWLCAIVKRNTEKFSKIFKTYFIKLTPTG